MKVDCEREDCVINKEEGLTTCIMWTPLYDKNGNLLNKDPNKTTTHFECFTCGREWFEKS